MNRFFAIVFGASLSLAAAKEPRSFTVQYLIVSAPKTIALTKRSEALRSDDLDPTVRQMFHEARAGRMRIECFENLQITESFTSNAFNGYEVRYPTEPEQFSARDTWGYATTYLHKFVS